METSVSWIGRMAGNPTGDDWRRLNVLYGPLLGRWAVRAGVPASEADDVVQNVLLVVFDKIGEFERQREGSFRAWLRAILTNKVRDYFSKENKQPTAAGDSWLDELESPDSTLSKIWDREHDEHVLKKLLDRVRGDFDPKTWQAFHRHVMEEEPAAQVAEALCLKLNSVLTAKSRVLKRLRQESAGLVE
jgi:RNA polymerase sigma-70 factor (ECF subfamily)